MLKRRISHTTTFWSWLASMCSLPLKFKHPQSSVWLNVATITLTKKTYEKQYSSCNNKKDSGTSWSPRPPFLHTLSLNIFNEKATWLALISTDESPNTFIFPSFKIWSTHLLNQVWILIHPSIFQCSFHFYDQIYSKARSDLLCEWKIDLCFTQLFHICNEGSIYFSNIK